MVLRIFFFNKVYVVYFQESKLDNIDNAIMRFLGGNTLVERNYINAYYNWLERTLLE